MPRYLISFDDGTMDHISENDLPSVSDAAHSVVRQARAAGVWNFGGCVHRQRASLVATDGSDSAIPFPQPKAVIGGFSIIDVAAREDALLWEARFAEAWRPACWTGAGARMMKNDYELGDRHVPGTRSEAGDTTDCGSDHSEHTDNAVA